MIGPDQYSEFNHDEARQRYYERMAMQQQNALGSLLGAQGLYQPPTQMQRAVPATPQEPRPNPVLLLTGDDE